MIIACPSCRTRYRVQAASLGRAGRTVRCSGCGELWFAEPPAEMADDPPPPLATPPPVPVAAAGGGGSPRPKGWAWAAATALLLPLAVLVLARNEVVARYPATAPAYQRLGLPVELPLGIEFRHLSSLQRRAGETGVLVVAGEIANVAAQVRQVPPIRIGLLDEGGREIDFALFDAPRPSLEPGAIERFEVELAAPPAEARDFSVSFAAAR
jgi:predicted Zn finger-like uncharacterized protein